MQTIPEMIWQVYWTAGMVFGVMAAVLIAHEQVKDKDNTVLRPLLWFGMTFVIWPVLMYGIVRDVVQRLGANDW